MIILYISFFFGYTLGSGIFEQTFPNRFACVNDIYKIAARNYTLKPEDIPNVPFNMTRVSYILETPKDKAIERELSELLLKLKDEVKNVAVGLTYKYQQSDLTNLLIDDYVFVNSELIKLHLLKTLTYDLNVYRLFALNSYNHFNGKTSDVAKYNLCSTMVYANVSDLISHHVDQVYTSINNSKSRVQLNLINLTAIKRDGKLSRYVSFANIYSISSLFIGFLLISCL